MKVLITGGAGFIGRWLVRCLPSEIEVVVVDRLEEQVHGPNPDFPQEMRARADCVRCDVRDIDQWLDAALGVDVVVHLAALTGTGQSMYQPSRYVECNVLGTSRVCEAIAAMVPKPRRVILSSSRAVYGEGAFVDGEQIYYSGPRLGEALAAGRWEVVNSTGVSLSPIAIQEDAPLKPTSIYGMTKAWQEQLLTNFCQSQGLEYLVLRMQNVYGPLQRLENPYTGIVGHLTNEIVRNARAELFEDGLMTRDFVYVGDVAKALVAGIEHRVRLTNTLNLGSGHQVTLRRLVRLLAEIVGTQPVISCHGRYRLGDVRHSSADMSSYEAAFGLWEPMPLVEGLREYLKWFMNQPLTTTEALAESLCEMEQHGLLLTAQ